MAFVKILLISSVSVAATWPKHNNGRELKFVNGIFNPQTLDMQNTDLEVFQDGKPGWFVNGLAVENISIVEGQEMIVGRMKINGYE